MNVLRMACGRRLENVSVRPIVRTRAVFVLLLKDTDAGEPPSRELGSLRSTDRSSGDLGETKAEFHQDQIVI